MVWKPNIRQSGGSEQIFCDWRRKFVRLTPEEWVRQHFLHMLVEHYGYPMSRLAVEQPIRVADTDKRCDAVIYDAALRPRCIIEFKASAVPLTQAVFDQVAVYNRALGVHYLMVSNGNESYACAVEADRLRFLQHLPDYTLLCKNT